MKHRLSVEALAVRVMGGAPVVLASRNAGKLIELRTLGAGALALEAPPSSSVVAEVVEDGASFLANARLKADAFAAATGAIALADDSGLEVDALGGDPGVHSGRFGGPGLDDHRRCLELLRVMRGVVDRSARFRCVLVLQAPLSADGWLAAEATLEGAIAFEPRGVGGFGYDPVFVPQGFGGRTLAEIGSQEKNAISHRALALCELLRLLRASAGPHGGGLGGGFR